MCECRAASPPFLCIERQKSHITYSLASLCGHPVGLCWFGISSCFSKPPPLTHAKLERNRRLDASVHASTLQHKRPLVENFIWFVLSYLGTKNTLSRIKHLGSRSHRGNIFHPYRLSNGVRPYVGLLSRIRIALNLLFIYFCSVFHLDGFHCILIPESCSPVTACIQTFFFSVVQINVSHFLLGLDVVGLLRRDVSEHAKRQLRISSQQGQVSVGYGHTELLRRSRELVDCILHHFRCFVLPDQRHAWVLASHCWKTLRRMRWDLPVLRWATRPPLTPGRQIRSQQDSARSSCAWTLWRMQLGGRSGDSWPSAESESPPSAPPSSSWPGPW